MEQTSVLLFAALLVTGALLEQLNPLLFGILCIVGAIIALLIVLAAYAIALAVAEWLARH